MGEQMDRAKGKAKEAVGDLTDDERLEREGKLDQASADVKEQTDDTVDRLRDGIREALRRGDPD
jgi:uncharacterized protein YjbJ (UPF0337 family)